jgi:hypothetical protein
VIEALKIRAGYTPLELQIVEKFRTKTGYKLYQMWRRYYSLPNHEAPLPLPEEAEPVEKGVIKKGMDELNAYLGMKYEHTSQLARTIQRGLDEIEKISNEKILLTVDKRAKEFKFVWLRPVEVKVYVDGSEFSMSFLPRFIVALDSQLIDNDMKDIKKEAIKLAKYHGVRLDSESLKLIKTKLKEYRKRNSLLV